MSLPIPEVIKYDRVRESRLNKREVTLVKAYLVDRDGNKCQICGKVPPEVALEIDHKDGNKKRHYYKNLQLLCKSDNCRKNPRGKKKEKGVDSAQNKTKAVSSWKISDDVPRARSLEFIRNNIAEPKFRHYIYQEMKTKTRMLYEDAVDGGAEEGGVQVERAAKYLQKMVSPAGRFNLVVIETDQGKKKYVVWKDEFSPFKDLEKEVLN